MMLKKIKGAYKSWTIWFNGISLAVIAGLPMLQDSLPMLSQYLDATVARTVGLVVVVANILLRFRTNISLADK